MVFKIVFSEEKNLLLKETRKIGFNDVIDAGRQGKVLDDLAHRNKKKYPNQRLLIINFLNYAYVIPYVIDTRKEVIFLKTIYPSREYTKKYLRKK